MGWLDKLFAREPEPPPSPEPPSAADIVAAVRSVEQQVEGKVPPAVTARVHRVARTVDDMAPRLDRFGTGSRQAHTVVATATSYLPEAVEGYLRLPREFANSRPVHQGKTALMLLCDQLDLLGVTLDKISDALAREDAVALVAHGEFLRQKFSTSGIAL